MTHSKLPFATLLLSLPLAACAGAPTDFEDETHVTAWANTASAYAVYGIAHPLIAYADQEQTFPDVACPVTSVDGDETTIVGGCTSMEDVTWVGRAVVRRGSDGSRDVTLEGFGSAEDGESPPRDTGTVRVREESADVHTFEIDVTRDALGGLIVDYSGRVEGDYAGPTTWSGAGSVTRTGFSDPSGTVSATTVDQRRDRTVCDNQNLSGTTTLVHGAQTVVLRYDGATDCDTVSSTPYSLNGEDRGSVSGITCAVSPGARGGLGGGLLLIAALGLLVRRRRGL